jgi:hypothetical protein
VANFIFHRFYFNNNQIYFYTAIEITVAQPTLALARCPPSHTQQLLFDNESPPKAPATIIRTQSFIRQATFALPTVAPTLWNNEVIIRSF